MNFEVSAPMEFQEPLNVPEKILMGPGYYFYQYYYNQTYQFYLLQTKDHQIIPIE